MRELFQQFVTGKFRLERKPSCGETIGQEITYQGYPDQILQFFYDMKKGDRVLAYGNKCIYGIGEIIGDYYYKAEESEEYPYIFFHRRDVKWVSIPEPPLSIDMLTDDLQKKLMRPRTIIELTELEWRDVEEALTAQPPEEKAVAPEPEVSPFYLEERQVRNFLAENPTILGEGLELVGKEYRTDGFGRIDALFRDGKGNFVVLETKKDRESDVVAGQILRYIGWVKKNLGPNVQGVIVTRTSDVNLNYAVEAVKDTVKLKYYKVKCEISDVPT